MEKSDAAIGKFVNRHLSQIKILTRLFEHEVDSSKGGNEISFERHLVENILDTLEIFVEDCETVSGRSRKSSEAKPQVARLN